MNSQTLLTRYAQGERDFSGANLRGCNFRGQNLSGINLSGADIRGANFAGATLTGANFSRARAGLGWRGGVGQLVVSLLIAIFAGILQGFSGHLIAGAVPEQIALGNFDGFIVLIAVVIIVIAAFYTAMFWAIARPTFTAGLMGPMAIAVAVIVTVANTFTVSYIFGFAVVSLSFMIGYGDSATAMVVAAYFIAAPVLVTVISGGMIAYAIADSATVTAIVAMTAAVVVTGLGIAITTGADPNNYYFWYAIIGAIVLMILIVPLVIFAFAVAVAGLGAGRIGIAFVVVYASGFIVSGVPGFRYVRPFLSRDGMVAGLVTGLVLALSIYGAMRSLRSSAHSSALRNYGLTFGALGGTCFQGADLTNANFSNAQLRHTNFRNARLHRVCFEDAFDLNDAAARGTILTDTRVLRLLTTLNGYGQSFVGMNLQGANLRGANLEGTHFKRADLTGATLQDANLKNANLTEAICIGTDFTHAYLTGACLQGWQLDASTCFDSVDCQYVFLLETPDPNGSRERRPANPEEVFAPGDLAKLCTVLFAPDQST
ncbi:MAG: pentapeptide repeat-containing protein [Synechococcales bacterium]|nr:pentapeptide repeat-containing protein [Synechococcales bacterium]